MFGANTGVVLGKVAVVVVVSPGVVSNGKLVVTRNVVDKVPTASVISGRAFSTVDAVLDFSREVTVEWPSVGFVKKVVPSTALLVSLLGCGVVKVDVMLVVLSPVVRVDDRSGCGGNVVVVDDIKAVVVLSVAVVVGILVVVGGVVDITGVVVISGSM